MHYMSPTLHLQPLNLLVMMNFFLISQSKLSNFLIRARLNIDREMIITISVKTIHYEKSSINHSLFTAMTQVKHLSSKAQISTVQSALTPVFVRKGAAISSLQNAAITIVRSNWCFFWFASRGRRGAKSHSRPTKLQYANKDFYSLAAGGR